MADRASDVRLSLVPRSGFIIAGLLALLLLIVWKVWNLEWMEQQSDPFFSDAANENPYLAAQLFLEHLRYAVSEGKDEDALEQLPEGKAVILLISGRAHLSEQRQYDLLRWINNGGHLITLANREWNEKTESIDDILRRQFDVAAVRTADNSNDLVHLLFDSSDTADSESDADKDVDANSTNGSNNNDSNNDEPNAVDGPATPQAQTGDDNENTEEPSINSPQQCPLGTPFGTTRIEWLDGKQLVADIGGKMRIEIGDVEPTVSAADALGLQFVQFHHGVGKVTFLSSMGMWSNQQIDSFDNAHLLALLADDAGQVIILHDFDAVPLTDLLKHFFPATLIMLVVLIAMVIFHFQQRWGSIVDTKAPPRRSLHEHITAGGRLLWRHRQVAPLIQRQQQLINDQLQRTQHNAPLTANEMQKLLASQTGIKLEQIRIAMREPASTQDELFEQIQLLQSIRNSL